MWSRRATDVFNKGVKLSIEARVGAPARYVTITSIEKFHRADKTGRASYANRTRADCVARKTTGATGQEKQERGDVAVVALLS